MTQTENGSSEVWKAFGKINYSPKSHWLHHKDQLSKVDQKSGSFFFFCEGGTMKLKPAFKESNPLLHNNQDNYLRQASGVINTR